jgi:TetR/AcrR family transcriptional regulator, transcriptional repressor for nem operon
MTASTKRVSSPRDTNRAQLVRIGTEILSEKGFDSTGIEEVLKAADVPKGSFYHYFPSKADFGLAVIDNYAYIWEQKLTRLLRDPSVRPLDRIGNYITEGIRGLEKYSFKRGCLIGNMSQGISGLDEVFRVKITKIFDSWSRHISDCLAEAQANGDLDPSMDVRAFSDFFWMSWEGAILKAKLEQSTRPIALFRENIFAQLKRTGNASV